jgi:type II secretion system protein G
MRAQVRKAFTLVEILIVVVILGILAAIVVPQFATATQDAQGGNIQTQLSTVQQAVELWKAKNNAYPDLVTDQWAQMVAQGYLKSEPKNPAAPSATQTVITAAPDAASGWHYDMATGTIGACFFDETLNTVTPGVP